MADILIVEARFYSHLNGIHVAPWPPDYKEFCIYGAFCETDPNLPNT